MRSTRLACALLATIASAAFAGAAVAQSNAPGFTPPKTSWGAPDLQGYWSNASITDMQRSPDYPNLVMTEAEVAKMEGADYYNNRTREDAKPNRPEDVKLLDGTDLLSGGGYNAFWVDQGSHVARVKGTPRSSWIVEPANGRIPRKGAAAVEARPAASTPRPTGAAAPTGTVQGPGAVDRNAGGGFGSYDNPETRPMGERCIIGFGNTGGPVMTNVLYNNTYQIVQSPTHAMILVEMVHDARIVPIFGSAAEARAKFRPGVIQQWLGDSVGWYEGASLVVETRNVHPQQRGFISKDGVLTERFSRWDDKQIVYEFTVDDPSQYAQAWKGEMAFNLSAEPSYEYACHEGNYAMEGILAGARAQERAGGTVAANADEE
jgi:hypothetical protein